MKPLRVHPENGKGHQECEPGGPQYQVPPASPPLLGKRRESEALKQLAFPAGRTSRRVLLGRDRGEFGWLVRHKNSGITALPMRPKLLPDADEPEAEPTKALMNARFKYGHGIRRVVSRWPCNASNRRRKHKRGGGVCLRSPGWRAARACWRMRSLRVDREDSHGRFHTFAGSDSVRRGKVSASGRGARFVPAGSAYLQRDGK